MKMIYARQGVMDQKFNDALKSNATDSRHEAAFQMPLAPAV